jgi:hypothetical protein
MSSRRFLVSILSLLLAAPVFALDRPFPQTAKRGTLTPATYPSIIIDGTTRRLSVGARIWNQNNLTQTPNSLQGSNLAINYTENADGEIDRVWILTQEEANKPLAK